MSFPTRSPFDDLKHLIVNDYRNNGRKSFGHLEQVRLPRLADVFDGTKDDRHQTAAVEPYKSLRLKDGPPRRLSTASSTR